MTIGRNKRKSCLHCYRYYSQIEEDLSKNSLWQRAVLYDFYVLYILIAGNLSLSRKKVYKIIPKSFIDNFFHDSNIVLFRSFKYAYAGSNPCLNMYVLWLLHTFGGGEKGCVFFIKHLLFICRVMAATCKKSFDVLLSTLFSLFLSQFPRTSQYFLSFNTWYYIHMVLYNFLYILSWQRKFKAKHLPIYFLSSLNSRNHGNWRIVRATPFALALDMNEHRKMCLEEVKLSPFFYTAFVWWMYDLHAY